LEKTGVGLPLGLLDDLQKFINDFFDELRYPHPARRVQDLSSLEGELLDSLVLRLHPFAEESREIRSPPDRLATSPRVIIVSYDEEDMLNQTRSDARLWPRLRNT